MALFFIQACKIGYYGQFCNISCPPGAFGVFCGGQCFPKSTDVDCDHVVGCIYKSTDNAKSAATTELTNTEQIYVPSSTPIAVKETTLIITEASLTNTSYVLFGVGVALFMLMFIIIIQLCKRSRSSRMGTAEGRSYKVSNEMLEMNVRKIKPSKKNTLYKQTEPVYHQIDEQFGIEYSPAVLSTSQRYEIPRLPQEPDNLFTLMINRDNYRHNPLNDMNADQIIEASDRNNSDLYLQPVSV